MQSRPPSDTRDLALIGAGNWGKNLARCFEELGALRVIVVPDGAEAAALRERFPHLQVSTRYEDVLADQAVRKVAIATPSATHFELAKAALLATKHVLVEKPMCSSVAQARALTKLADSSGSTLMVGHLLQYHPCVDRLRELVAQGALGRILTISSNRLNLGRFRTDENALFSFAPHDLSLVLSLLEDQLPRSVRCVGTSYLKPGVADSTLTILQFAGGALAQLHVSWLNPFKEQKLTVVGTHGMAVFDDTKPWSEKLLISRDYLRFDRSSVARAEAHAEAVQVAEQEPLKLECQHFIRACDERLRPRTDGREGLRVLEVLDMAQRSLDLDGERVTRPLESHYYAEPSAVVADGASVGAGSKIWHFCHVMAGARLGERVSLGQNVFVAGGVEIGDDVKVQNNVSLYEGVQIEAHVFVGPSCVFTNVKNPRAEVSRKGCYEKTLVRRGASLGANCTVVCGVTLGRYCLIGAGAVVTADVPDYALMVGNPARRVGWLSRRGQRLTPAGDEQLICPETGERYRELSPDRLICLGTDDI
jgi:UDP-2-acetamido-3-amino-2,3-dideoxy-glucuronate N-acetyltransferase